MATLVYDAALDDEPELVEAVGAAAARAREGAPARGVRGAPRGAAGVARAAGGRRRPCAPAAGARPADDAQQRLVALSLRLRMIQGRVGAPAARRDLVDTASDGSRSRSRSSASSRAASIPPAQTTDCPTALEALAVARPSPTLVESESRSVCPGGSSSPPTSSPARRWPTSPVLAGGARLGPADAQPTAWPSIQSPTTGSAAPTSRRDPVCAGSATASKRSPGGSMSPARPGPGQSSPRSCPSSSVGRMTAERDLDVVVYGATGFVGGLTARYLAEHAPEGARIGLAGPQRGQARAVRSELGSRAAAWPLLVADSARSRRPRRDGAPAPAPSPPPSGPTSATASRSCRRARRRGRTTPT